MLSFVYPLNVVETMSQPRFEAFIASSSVDISAIASFPQECIKFMISSKVSPDARFLIVPSKATTSAPASIATLQSSVDGVI